MTRLRSILVVVALTLGLGAAAFIALKPRVEQVDRVIGPLPVARLDGTPIDAASFAGRPWVVNVWMPG